MKASRAATVATRVYAPESTAAAFRLASLVQSLQRHNYRVTVLTSRAPRGPRSTQGVKRWPVLRDKSGAVRGYAQYASFDIPLFFRLVFGRKADLVIVEPPPTTGVVTRIACWIRRVPYFYYSADVLSSAVSGIGLNRFVVAAVAALERAALRGAVGILAVSDEVKQEVVRLGAPAERVRVIGTGIDTTLFTPSGPVVNPGYPYFVYAGTMSEVHGAQVFLQAFAKVAKSNPEVRLKMFGAGAELDELKKQARKLGDRVEFPGLLPASELAGWIRGAQASLASVRPGQGYDFAFATKGLASLGCGTPVIYAGVGPLNSLIAENDLGWATEWDPTPVAQAMSLALLRSSPEPDQRLANWVESHYSMLAVANRAVLALDELVSVRLGTNDLP